MGNVSSVSVSAKVCQRAEIKTWRPVSLSYLMFMYDIIQCHVASL